MSIENREWSSNNPETEWRPLDTVKRVYIIDVGINQWYVRYEFDNANYHDAAGPLATEAEARTVAKQIVDEELVRR